MYEVDHSGDAIDLPNRDGESFGLVFSIMFASQSGDAVDHVEVDVVRDAGHVAEDFTSDPVGDDLIADLDAALAGLSSS